MPEITAGTGYRAAIPFLAVADVDAAIEFYVQRLGFIKDWSWGTWGTPTSDAGLRRDGVVIYLTRDSELAGNVRGFEVVLQVADVDAAYEEHQRLGAPVLGEPEDKPWGTREYYLDDPTGYRLRITQVGNDGSL